RKVVDRADQPGLLVGAGEVLGGRGVDQREIARVGPPGVLDIVARAGNRERSSERKIPVDQLNARPTDLRTPLLCRSVSHQCITPGTLGGELGAEADRPVPTQAIAVVPPRIYGVEGVDAVLVADADT